jgi:alkylmercury lyase
MTDNASWKILVGDDRMALLPRAIALLAEGVPVPLRRLAAGAGWTEEKVAATLRGIPRVDWDADGNLIGLGLSLAPTTHRVCIDGRELFTWCAADTLMLPAMLGRPVAVRSTCPTTGTAIRLTVTPQGIESVTPDRLCSQKFLPPRGVTTSGRVCAITGISSRMPRPPNPGAGSTRPGRSGRSPRRS